MHESSMRPACSETRVICATPFSSLTGSSPHDAPPPPGDDVPPPPPDDAPGAPPRPPSDAGTSGANPRYRGDPFTEEVDYELD